MASFIRRGVSSVLRSSPIYRLGWPTIQQVRTLDYDGDAAGAMSTTVQFINEQKDGVYIDAFSHLGFRLSTSLRILGPIVVFPRSVLHWNVMKAADINEASLSLFTLVEPKLDILILGVGDKSELTNFNTAMITHLRNKRISVEVLPTEQALATFNFLNSEKRFVSGAFIPPSFDATVGWHDSDYISPDFINEDSGMGGIFEDTHVYDINDRRLTSEEAKKSNITI